MNILPNKHVEEKDTLLYAGALILKELNDSPKSVSMLWNHMKNLDSIKTFDRFVATLDMLFILGAIEFKNNKLNQVIL